jgi:cyclopropane-fatty-acyl-phospholipid synthase
MHRVSDEIEEAARRWHGGASSRVFATDRWLASQVQATIDAAAVRLELWDGTSAYGGTSPPLGDLVVHDRRTLVGLAVHPELYFGEGYVSGSLTIRGELRAVVEALTRYAPREVSWAQRISALLSRNTPIQSRRNVHHHYDLGNDFYRLWLDGEMVYTCAYYAAPDMSLDEAQRAKMDHVCRKLRLRPDETVVEAGCGWGALALHMARHYGVRVRAFNVSREQLAYARERAAREGLSSRVEFVDDDYRNVSGRVDVFVSVGMLEHVGLRNFAALSDVIGRTVRPEGGRGLLHFIGRDAPRPLNAWVRRRIFPGAYPPALAEVTSRVLTPAGMSVLDVENLRLHYARTLSHWSAKFGAAGDVIRRMYSEEFQRAWDLYLAGSEAAFTTGWMQLFQIVFAPRESAPPSWTRADRFEPDEAPA